MNDLEQAIEEVISQALLAGRLAPGTPLRETALADVFGVSRERIRKILQRLGVRNLIAIVPNRGAFVCTPSLEQAREIYEARRIVEAGIMAQLASNLGREESALLEKHIEREARALRKGDRAESVRLSAEFHMLLAGATGSPYVVQQMQELVSRTSMLVAMFEPANSSRCACEEHQDIFTSLLAGDSARSVRSMRAHLSLVETRLRPTPTAPVEEALPVLGRLWRDRSRRLHGARTSQ